ncbi:hypothetical protein MRBLMR1_002138 [Neorhizobium sp. LMR1-1-1.1]
MDYSLQTEVILSVTPALGHWATDRPRRRYLPHALRAVIQDMESGWITAFKITLPDEGVISDVAEAKQILARLQQL